MGGLINKLGQGVGMAMEYRQHRQQQKARMTTSQESSSNTLSVEQDRTLSRTPLPGRSPERPEKRPISYVSEKKQMSDSKDRSPCENDEVDWEQDEANYSDEPPSYEDSEKLAQQVINMNRKHSVDQSSFNSRPLPCPVIVPQRRPGSKSRGFVRAYAPLLGECSGIDQETFLSFLKNFHKSSQASPIFGIIQISAGIASFAPSAIAMVVTTAAGAAAQQGAQMQEKSRFNGFLDEMNKELFMPKGLFAVVMQYKTDADPTSMLGRFGVGSSTAALDSNQAIAGRLQQTASSGAASFFSKQSVYSGTTQGAAAMPESAPLIFPEPEYKLDHDGPETFKDKTRDFKKFMGGYMDRKAQQKYAEENPDSGLVMPQQQRGFNSNPNNAMFSGGLVGLVSGGQLSKDRLRNVRNGPPSGGSNRSSSQQYASYGGEPVPYGDSKGYYDSRSYGYDEDDRESRDSRRRGDGRRRDRRRDSSESSDDRRRGKDRKEDRGGIGGGVKRAMQEGVLYLMIVNMPSESELEQARRQLGAGGQR